MVAIIGQVGCGKSTLLHAILGELHLTENSHIESGPISYCSQTPWLFEASVRQNILFGLEMDNLRYKRVIKACQLEDDFKMLPHKDKTIVGERGIDKIFLNTGFICFVCII